MYTLHITNKNYSSWSLRPWVLMRACDIAFNEVLHPYTPGNAVDFRDISPTGKVPWLTCCTRRGSGPSTTTNP